MGMKTLTLLFFLAFTSTATAMELGCADKAGLFKVLKQSYGEKQVAAGTVRNHALGIFANDNGNFTIVIIKINGLACILATGRRWHQWQQKSGLQDG